MYKRRTMTDTPRGDPLASSGWLLCDGHRAGGRLPKSDDLLTTTPITHRDEWNALLRSLPYAHILQTWEWGEFKRQTTGWQPRRLMFKQADQLVALASIGVRSVGPLKIMYAPKGPVFASDDPATWSLVLDHLAQMARRERVIWLKIDPDVALATGTPGEADDQAEAAGTALVSMEKRGREHYYQLRPDNLNEIARWIGQYEHFWQQKLDALGDYLDEMAAQDEQEKP